MHGPAECKFKESRMQLEMKQYVQCKWKMKWTPFGSRFSSRTYVNEMTT